MPTTFVIGQIFMLFGRKDVEASRFPIRTFPLIASLVYALVVFLPVTGWYFFAHTGWSTVYLRPENSIPWFAAPFILFCYFLGMFFGALIAQLLIQAGRWKFIFLTLGLGVVWLAGIFCLTFDEYTHIGTFAEYHSGTARLIFDDKSFMKELNVMGALLFVPAIGLAFYLWKRQT